MMGTKSSVYRFGEFELREREFSLVKAGEAVDIEHKAFRALLFLLRNPQKLIPKEELVHAVWSDTAVADGSLTRCIWHLRRCLGDDFNEPRYIETVAKVGYRLICVVVVVNEEIQPEPGPPPVPPVLPDPAGSIRPADVEAAPEVANPGCRRPRRRPGRSSLVPTSPAAAAEGDGNQRDHPR